MLWNVDLGSRRGERLKYRLIINCTEKIRNEEISKQWTRIAVYGIHSKICQTCNEIWMTREDDKWFEVETEDVARFERMWRLFRDEGMVSCWDKSCFIYTMLLFSSLMYLSIQHKSDLPLPLSALTEPSITLFKSLPCLIECPTSYIPRVLLWVLLGCTLHLLVWKPHSLLTVWDPTWFLLYVCNTIPPSALIFSFQRSLNLQNESSRLETIFY